MLEGEDYEMIYTIKVPNEKVNAVKCDRNSGNFIFGFDYNLKICDSKGNLLSIKILIYYFKGIELISIELNRL